MIEKIEIGKVTGAQIIESEARGRVMYATVSLFDGAMGIKYDDLFVMYGNHEYKFKYLPTLCSGMERSAMEKNKALFSLRMDGSLPFNIVDCVLYAKTYA